MENSVHILLVEDNEGDIELFKEVAEEYENCFLHTVFDGDDAIDFLYKEGIYTSSPSPHLILLDLNLPGTSGREVLKIIKREDEFRGIPTVVISSSQNPKDIKSLYEAGASGYIHKPMDAKAFIDCANTVLSYWTRFSKVYGS